MSKGLIDIGKIYRGGEGTVVRICVQHSPNRAKAITVEMSFEDFGKAITGSGDVPCTFTTYED